MAAVTSSSLARLLQYIEQSQIGYDAAAKSAYGTKPVVYADYTASGRSLDFIEEYISGEVLPFYGNTHTTTSFTSRQSSHFREEARSIIKEAVNCSENDALIFAGSGCTGAVHKLVHCLSLDLSPTTPGPVVFVGPFEHHSNLLPWRELPGALVLRIKENAYGEVDINDLRQKLEHYSKTGRQMIGTFNAASNITGVLTDTDAFSTLIHQYGGLALWDYATAAPYIKIDMNPPETQAYKDAVFFSMHKFVGGPDTPGVLIAKKHLFRNKIPHVPGGGTVEFVTQGKHCYHAEPEEREEGGTPSIVGAVRAGLAMQLKEAVGSECIMALEDEVCGHVFSQWEGVEELVLVGPHHVPRLPIFSFLVRHTQSGLFLHHYFVSALLNDLFGIQARGGCSCAGPYGQALLDISEDLARDIVMDSCSGHCERELTKPGMTRLSFPYFMSQEVVEYIIQAVAMVARYGWKLLHQYTMDPKTGSFSHKDAKFYQERRSLGSISFSAGRMTYADQTQTCDLQPPTLKTVLEEAQSTFDTAFDEGEQPSAPVLPHRVERVRWFLLPHEAWEYGHGRTTPITQASFQPKKYLKKKLPHHHARVSGAQTRVNGARTKVSRLELNRNRSFKLYIEEDADEGGRHSDSGEAVVGDLVTTRATVHARWAYTSSTTQLDQLGAEITPKPETVPPYFPSCGDLSSPAMDGGGSCSKHTGGVKKIKRRIKAFLWQKKH